MIRTDYSHLLRKLMPAMAELGYANMREDDLLVQFPLFSGWTVELECEPYYGPAFSLNIVSPRSENAVGVQKKYAVWILMQIFEAKTEKEYGPFTIENQAKFLIDEEDKLFGDASFYDADYDRRNSSI